jgi:hypothetical protein
MDDRHEVRLAQDEVGVVGLLDRIIELRTRWQPLPM